MKRKRFTALCLCLCLIFACQADAMTGPPYAATFQMGPRATVYYGGEYYDMCQMTNYNNLPLVRRLFEDNGWDLSEYGGPSGDYSLRDELQFLNGTIYFSKFPDGGGYDFLITSEEYLYERAKYYAFGRSIPDITQGGVFDDVGMNYRGRKPGDYHYKWYHDGVYVTVREGFFSGYKLDPPGDLGITRTFGLHRTMTRAEVLSTLTRSAFPVVRSYNDEFYDVPATAWYYEPIKRAYEAGLIDGEAGDAFGPDNLATREFTALVLSRVMSGGVSVEVPFTDAAELSHECREAAELLTGSGIIGGYEDRTFRPQATITRAEYAVMLGRMIDNGLYSAKTPSEAFCDECIRRVKEEYSDEEILSNAIEIDLPDDVPFPFYG